MGKVREYSHKDASVYESRMAQVIPGYDKLLDITAKDIILLSPRKILDLGIGTGPLALKIFRKCPYVEIEGWDISDAMLSLAAEYFQDYNLILYKGDIFFQKFLPNKYDVVIASFFFHHGSRNEKHTLMNKIFHSLKSNSCLYMIDFFLGETDVKQKKFSLFWRQHLEYFGLSLKEIEDFFREIREVDTPESLSTIFALAYEAGFVRITELESWNQFGVFKFLKL